MRELKQWSGQRVQVRAHGRVYEGIIDFVSRDALALIDVHVSGAEEPLETRLLLPLASIEYAQVPR